MFENADGGCGVVGGPHEVFTAIERKFYQHNSHLTTFFSEQLLLYRYGYQINPDVSLLGDKPSMLQVTSDDTWQTDVYVSKRIKMFNDVEETGSEITYRCIKCRSCKTCKDHKQSEGVSIREEIEQDIINKSVHVDVTERKTTASLPFIHNPEVKLAPNKHLAMKVYQQQLKKLKKNEKDKEDIIASEGKLQKLGHVDYVKNLSDDQKQLLQQSKIQNYIPWRAVWKLNSLSTPCRLVFDASQPTDSGYSLNDLLAKGRNNMNKLQEILLRWMTHKTAFHTDIQKMYNSVKLVQEHWCFQRYIWSENLDPGIIPDEKVIKTLIYGIRSSGNQAEFGLRETANHSKETFPEVAEIVCKDTYVDDCLSGDRDLNTAKQRADELEVVLNRGGFALKGVTFSGSHPPENLSDDGESICVAGMMWHSKEDLLSFDIGELNFSKKSRGRKLSNEESKKIPKMITRRHCVSKVAEVYDLTGKIMPIISSMKIDLHELVERKLDWDDVIPDNLRSVWVSNFEMIQELKDLRYNRAVIPEDAESLDLHTIDFGDASMVMACSAIYVRFKKINGEFSCQLVFARSKLLPSGTSQPRGELIAALLNTHTGEVVKRAFGVHHKSHLKISDSEIALYWITNDQKQLKSWVLNRVIDIHRFTDVNDWYYTDTSNMIADLGTRRGATIDDVNQSSVWINGYEWMKNDVQHMPIKSIKLIKLKNDDLTEVLKESHKLPEGTIYTTQMVLERSIPKEVVQRYEFSRYIIDPMKYDFMKVVRIMAFVLKFINCTRSNEKRRSSSTLSKFKSPSLTSEDMEKAKNYFFKKATLEVKHFNKERFYSKFSKEKDDILFYTGRILSSNEVSAVGRMTVAMKDLSPISFCVPVLDKHSPLSYSIINHIHWKHQVVKHSGIESVWRQVLHIAFVIEGREIVKLVRKLCQRCRYLMKRSIDVAMGPISNFNLTIAPAFYICQVDLAGPFQAYSNHHKRTTVKVWMAVFCCCTTSTISIKMMEDYSSSAFIQAFIRLSCEVGYPKMLLPDEGSQLVKSCESMLLNFKDIKQRLFVDAHVEFNVCPVGAHYMHGRVERKIKEIKSSLEKNIQGERLSILQWETVVSQISNSINDMPLALGNVVGDFEAMDLITPNRLKLGRNNNRSPEGTLSVSSNPDKFLKSNEAIFNSWFETWLTCHIPKLMYKPKWFQTSHNLQEGDIVLFLKVDSNLLKKYQYGMVKSVVCDKDGLIRKATISYQNSNENTKRETVRSARELVKIYGVDETDIVKELGEICSIADMKFKNDIQK